MSSSSEYKTIAFDIDGTICTQTNGDYSQAMPYSDRILHVNALFDRGVEIVLFTARGATSRQDYTDLTRNQLQSWGVRYTHLIMGKPHADLFVDDKAINSETYDWKQ
jgi:ribonucleotide monophosphatase NagD (HAD superfamily)